MVNSPKISRRVVKGKAENVLETHTGGTTILMTSDPKKAEVSTNPLVQGAATIRQGGVPHNEVIEEAINEMEEIVAEETKENPLLNAQGRKLAQDLVSMGEATKKIVHEKNYDEVFQSAIASTSEGIKELSVHGEMLSVETEEMKIESQKLLDSIKQLSLKFLTSGEIREITSEVLELFKMLWYSSHIPEKVTEATSNLKANLATTLGVPMPEETSSKEEVTPSSSSKATVGTEPLIPGFEAPPVTSKTPSEVTPLLQQTPLMESEEEFGIYQPLSTETTGTFTSTEMMQSKKEFSASWSEPSHFEMSEEDFVDRFRNILLRISSKSEFQEVIQNIRTIQFITKRRAEMHNQHFDSRPFKDASRLFRRFVGDKEFRKFKSNFWDIWEDIRHDQQMEEFFHDLYRFTQKTFQDTQYLNSSEYKCDAVELIRRGRFLTTQKKYMGRLTNLVSQGNDMLNSIKNDSTLNTFQSSVEQFAKDFGLTGPKGQPDLLKMTTGIDQLRMLMLPVFRKMLENIPLARVEIYSPSFDMMVDDLYLDGTDILPEFFRMKLDNKIEADLRVQGGPSHNRTRLWVEISGMKPKFKHFKFAYQRKTFPKLNDQGMANLIFKGNGAKIVFVWELHTDLGKTPVAKLKYCKCVIDSIDIQILEAEKHSWFDQMAANVMGGSLKRKLCAAIEDMMESNVEGVNTQLNNYFRETPMQLPSYKSPFSS